LRAAEDSRKRFASTQTQRYSWEALRHLRRGAGPARWANKKNFVKIIRRGTLRLALALTPSLSPTAAASLFGGTRMGSDGTISLVKRRRRPARSSTNSTMTTMARSIAPNLKAAFDQDWAVADPDNDKTLTKDEYLNYVEKVFKRADTDGDGTVDAKEA